MELGVLLLEGRAKIENDTRVDAGRGNLISLRTAKWNVLQFRTGGGGGETISPIMELNLMKNA
jgi:hypothetical protein